MKESLPDHFKVGPCAGLQFLDEDSFMYYLEVNHPIINTIIQALLFIYIIFIFLLFILIPCLSFIVISYYMIVRNSAIFGTFKCGLITKKFLRWTMFSIISSALIILLPIFYSIMILFICDSIINCFFTFLSYLFGFNQENGRANLL